MTQKLPKNAKKVWRTRATLVFLLISFICGGIYVFSPTIALIVEGVNSFSVYNFCGSSLCLLCHNP